MYSFRRLFEYPNWLSFLVLIALHYASIQISFLCGKTPENEVIIWLPNAVLLVALLRLRLSLGLIVAVVTYTSNVISNMHNVALDEAMLLGAVNLVEIGITLLIMHLTHTSSNLVKLKDYSNFLIAGPLVGAFVSGLLGAAVISAYGAHIPYLALLRFWWFSDGLGLLIFAPILMFASSEQVKDASWRLIDVIFAMVIVALIAMMFFNFPRDQAWAPLTPTLIIPFALLLSLRFNILSTSIGVALISLAVSKMVAIGLNPFGDSDLNRVILHTQEFILTISIICMGASIFQSHLRLYAEGLEAKVEERTKELAANLVQMKSLQSELIHSAKLASLGSIVAGVSHELNTPLGNAKLATSTMRERLVQVDENFKAGSLTRSQIVNFLRDGLEITDLNFRSIDRAVNLVSSFKQVSVDQTSERRRKFDLAKVVNETITTIQPTFKHAPWKIEIDIPELIEIESYPGPLEQIIFNLVMNSIQHGFEGRDHGRIKISSKTIKNAKDGYTQIELSFDDDGKGIAPDLVDRVFEPFFTTRLGQGGSGLGLHICYRLATTILGGAIKVVAKSEPGTIFSLTIPQTAPAPVEPG
ncbi:signal transduction histidine kinase [Oxalobacteraceae bacterium GrIS 2.11]